MGAITVCIPDELEIAFRRIARKKYGDKQGKLSRGATEALYDWCRKEGFEYLYMENENITCE
ncbi:MAG: hypothetical protein PQ975_03330 [Methanobacterium sp.]|jgi:hypothetical protein